MKIIVTRHAGLIAYLKEVGLTDGTEQVLSHVDNPAQIAGCDVVGVLPLHLAAQAASVTEIPLALTPEDRGRDLPVERVREIAQPAQRYTIRVCGADDDICPLCGANNGPHGAYRNGSDCGWCNCV